MLVSNACRYFFLNDTATTEIYTYLHTLSLHDALPICRQPDAVAQLQDRARYRIPRYGGDAADRQFGLDARAADRDRGDLGGYSRAHARTLWGHDRDSGFHDAGLEGRPIARGVARRGPAGAPDRQGTRLNSSH